MSSSYKTSEVAKIIGIHPNTVRLYEEWSLISPPQRLKNGYRVFTELHIAQFRLARTALHVEVLQNGLRKLAVTIVKTMASGNIEKAMMLANTYLEQIRSERQNAEETIEITAHLWSVDCPENPELCLTRKEAATALDISMETLRNWERNGLLIVDRKKNGYLIYTGEDVKRLKIIRTLRCANYSLAAILRLLSTLSCAGESRGEPGEPCAELHGDPGPEQIREILDTPREEDDIISICDKLLTSLSEAECNAKEILRQLGDIAVMTAPATEGPGPMR